MMTERNLNPKAACLKRREEEKNEEAAGRPTMLLGPPGDLSQQLASSGVAGNKADGILNGKS